MRFFSVAIVQYNDQARYCVIADGIKSEGFEFLSKEIISGPVTEGVDKSKRTLCRMVKDVS